MRMLSNNNAYSKTELVTFKLMVKNILNLFNYAQVLKKVMAQRMEQITVDLEWMVYICAHGDILSSRLELDWASINSGPAISLLGWKNFLIELESKQLGLTMDIRGGWLMTKNLTASNGDTR